MNDGRITGTHVAVAFVAGAAVGTVIALLTTPKSGQEMRDSLSEMANNGARRAAALPRAARHAYTQAASAARQAFDRSLEENQLEKVGEPLS